LPLADGRVLLLRAARCCHQPQRVEHAAAARGRGSQFPVPATRYPLPATRPAAHRLPIAAAL